MGRLLSHRSSLSLLFRVAAAAALFAAALPSQAAHRRHHHTVAHMRRVARHIPTSRTTAQATIAPVPLRHVASLPPLKGSYESLVRQNERTQAEGLKRIEDDAQLDQMREQKMLVGLPVSDGLRVNTEMPSNRRYCRPWTAKFLGDLGQMHYARFRRPLQINSAVRTVEYQRHLMAINGNAAPAEGDIASPHLTGATIDIGKKGLSTSEVAWMRGYLMPLQSEGKIDVEEEFHQSCFHITVYADYAPAGDRTISQPAEFASTGRAASTVQAASSARPAVVRASLHRPSRRYHRRRMHASLLASARLR